ncbi:MAG: pyridoxal-phosphate dependent enzyme [Anaerolineales bacterium]|nr:pyridoxal-phosphate dependent enzyme [Anaerolineales bacterium]
MARTALGAREVLIAQKRIRKVLNRIPIIRSESLSCRVQGDVWLKLESSQPTGSFKVRGALNALSGLEDLSGGIVTGSAGNHGLGVAFAAESLGIKGVTIFVPETAPEAKIRRLQAFAIDLRFAGTTYEHAHQAAVEFAKQQRAVYIPAYDDEKIIAGQGTVGLEILEELPEIELIIVPVGGGGLIAGIATAVKELAPSVEVVGVQAQASPSAYLSLRDGTPYDPFDHAETIADGLAGGFGAKPFYLARSLIQRILLFDERVLRECVYTLLDEERIVAEPSGAVVIAPLLEADDTLRGKQIICVISGSNIETGLLREILFEFSER